MTRKGTPEEVKKANAEYAKKYRAEHRDKFNAYMREHMRKYRREHPEYREYYRFYAKRWRAENPEKHKESRRKFDTPERNRKYHLMGLYGLSVEQYEAMLAEQGGVCALCGKPPKGNGNRMRLHVDHNHETGENRGLLCGPCNVAMERIDNIPDWLDNLAGHLQKYR